MDVRFGATSDGPEQGISCNSNHHHHHNHNGIIQSGVISDSRVHHTGYVKVDVQDLLSISFAIPIVQYCIVQYRLEMCR